MTIFLATTLGNRSPHLCRVWMQSQIGMLIFWAFLRLCVIAVVLRLHLHLLAVHPACNLFFWVIFCVYTTGIHDNEAFFNADEVMWSRLIHLGAVFVPNTAQHKLDNQLQLYVKGSIDMPRMLRFPV